MNRIRISQICAAAALFAQVTACGGGAGDLGVGGGSESPDLTQSNRFCHTIPPVSSMCQPCANTNNPVQAFDGNLATYAEMLVGGQSTFRGISSEVQTAGSLAGVYFVLPDQPGVTVSLSTYLNGTLQEAAEPAVRQWPSDTCSGGVVCEFSDGSESFVGMPTGLPYDEIRATISNSGTDEILIYELCVR